MMTANSGFGAWLWQRGTAIYLGVYIIAMLLFFTFIPPQSATEWVTVLRQPFLLTSSVLFFIALGIHTWIGLRDILFDYIHTPALKLFSLSMVTLSLLFLLTRALLILLKL